jgi:adenine-specific DNA-methyltransferase
MDHPKLIRIARVLRKHDTWAEKLLWRWLRNRRFSNYKFRRQHPMGPHVLDFFCEEAQLNIELDGSQHGFPEQKHADVQRDAWLESRGIKVLRFWNSRLRREAQPIRDTIWWTLQQRAPHPLPDYCRPMPIPATSSAKPATSRLGNTPRKGDPFNNPSPSPYPSPKGEG